MPGRNPEAAGRPEADQLHGRQQEINHASADKGAALKWLCSHLGIPLEHTLAIGDGDNDMEMIQYAGWGIAMGNSRDELKRLAPLCDG